MSSLSFLSVKYARLLFVSHILLPINWTPQPQVQPPQGQPKAQMSKWLSGRKTETRFDNLKVLGT
jgi:hypothetical protein